MPDTDPAHVERGTVVAAVAGPGRGAVTRQQAGHLLAFVACCALVLGGFAGLWVSMRELWIARDAAALRSGVIILVITAGAYGVARLWPPRRGRPGRK